MRPGLETSIDCGGADCLACDDGLACAQNGDCKSNVCNSLVCQMSMCNDNTKNGGETDVDCGGATCLPCAPNAGCKVATDCTSGVCGMGPGPSLPMAVAADRSDNMVITGYFDAAPFDIGGGALPYAGNRDIYLGVFDGTNGAHLFSTAYGGANDDQPSGVFADRRTGDVLLTGEFQLTMGIGATSLASDGAYDIFLASLGTIP